MTDRSVIGADNSIKGLDAQARREHYLRLADEAEQAAEKAGAADVRETYRTMARSWRALAKAPGRWG